MDVGPLMVAARNEQQAAYLVRSRAQQRGVDITDLSIAPASPGMWAVTVCTSDDATAAALRLADTTGVLRLPQRDNG